MFKFKKTIQPPETNLFKQLLNNIVAWLNALLMVGIIGLFVVAYLCWQMFMQSIALTNKDKVIHIQKGDTYYKLIDSWYQQELINNRIAAKLYTKFFVHEELKAGSYKLTKGDKLAKVLSSINSRSDIKLIDVRIVAGKTSKDLLKTLRANKNLKNTLQGLSNADILEQIGATEGHIEGIFAPNTYLYAKNTSDITILKDLYSKQKRTLENAWATKQADLPYKTPYEALIIASIIERETHLSSERNKVAAVFINRLRKGMRLQTDPTVIYGMGEKFKGNISKKDLQTKTAYNTYRIDGLPPTPISLPSAASINAAVNPADIDSLFFVASGEGGHVFTKTYDEHKKAVAEYLKTLKKNKEK